MFLRLKIERINPRIFLFEKKNVRLYIDYFSLRTAWLPYTWREQPKARTRRVIYERTYFTRSACARVRLLYAPYVVMHVRDKHFCISRKEKRLGRCPRFHSRRRTMRAFVRYSTNATVSHLHRVTNSGYALSYTELKKNCFSRQSI